MKVVLFLSLFFICGFSFSVQAAEYSYGKCSFACKSIPKEKDVLYSMGTASSHQLNSKNLNILVWNLYKGRNKEFPAVFAKLAKDRDVILLSEVINEAPISTSLAKLTNFSWDMAAAFLMKNKVATGTAIGSYAEARNVRFYRTKDVEPFVKSPKATTLTEYAIPGSTKTLLAISIHGINWDGDDSMVRQLEMMMPDIEKHQGPIVFAGDFNFKNPTRLKLAQQILGRAGVTRVPWQNPNTKKQLDDAFTRGVKVHKARLINDYIDKGSDHPAIELQLEILD